MRPGKVASSARELSSSVGALVELLSRVGGTMLTVM